MEEYLGIMIDHNGNGSYHMSQLFLIKRIINSIPIILDTGSAKTLVYSSLLLTKDEWGDASKEYWNYRSVIGMLNFLIKCMYPEISFDVHQYARFCNDPKWLHEQAVKRTIRYLLCARKTSNQWGTKGKSLKSSYVNLIRSKVTTHT